MTIATTQDGGMVYDKYIKIYEYRKLDFLLQNYGYRGPITSPIKTPMLMKIDLIRQILSMTNPPKVYETLKAQDWPKVVWAADALLTLDNYTQTYYEITGTTPPPPVDELSAVAMVAKTAEVAAPTTTTSSKNSNKNVPAAAPAATTTDTAPATTEETPSETPSK